MKIFCLVKNRVISMKELRNSRHQIILATDPAKWKPRHLEIAKIRIIEDKQVMPNE